MKDMLVGDPDGLSDEELHKRTVRATIISRTFILAGIIFMVTTVTLVVVLTLNVNRIVSGVEEQQDSNTPVLEQIQDLSAKIESCTNPQGECAKRGQENQGKAIAQLNQYAVYLEACADAPGQQSERELRACADALVERAASGK